MIRSNIISEDIERFFAHAGADFLDCKDDLLHKADTMIDILTHNRINGIGWNNLTQFQQTTLCECLLEIVQFLYENKDLLETPLSSYNINGVSMQFKFNPTVFVGGGAIMRQSTYGKLVSTGLCYAGGL